MTTELNRIGVVGAGNIGQSVIADLLLHGFEVIAADISDDQLARAKAEILKMIRFAPFFSKALPRLSSDEAAGRLHLATDLEALAPCDFVIENVPENWSIKEPIYHRLDEIMPGHVCLGPNTSCIPITRIAAATRRPDKVIGLHFMNPVHLMKTVEVIRGFHTSDETLRTLEAIFARCGKRSVVVEDLPGFVSNRISHVFMNEAAFVLQDQLATPEKIDLIFKQCFGHKMGPLETADLIGLDTIANSLHVLYTSFQDPKYRVCPLLRKLVDAGHLGRKTGRGFYVYPTAT